MTQSTVWQIRDAEGHILADNLRWPVVNEVLSVFQHHNMRVTLHKIDAEVTQ